MDEREPKQGIMSIISSNVTAEGGTLDEETFVNAMRQAAKPPKPQPVVVSMGVIRRAQANHGKARERAARAHYAYRRLRRWQWIKRFRALREYHEQTAYADALRSTFRPHID